MKRPALFCDGRPLRLGRRLGRGGEGEVLALKDDATRALKLYTAPDAAREAKVRAMVAAGLAARSDLVAFPAEVVETEDGHFAGFLMRKVEGCQPLFELYAPGARKRSFPQADYRFIVRAAANIARAVAKVHESGAVIGDINHSGVLICKQATATLIDADSFQFGRHRCRVGVPEYTPPELQGGKLGEIDRTPAHDAFGLAVIVFQLLFMGRHPYAGRYAGGEMPTERAIAEHRFAWSRRRATGMTPPPGSVRLDDLPDEIADAFEDAFGRDPARRPAAADWVERLGRMEASLVRCTVSPLHHSPGAACLWCRIERQAGMKLFLPKGSVTRLRDPGFDLDRAWARIEAVGGADIDRLAPALPSFVARPSDHALAALREHDNTRLWGLVAVIGTALLIKAFPYVWTLYLITGGYGLGALVGKLDKDVQRWRLQRADRAFARALDDWRERIGAAELVARRKKLEAARDAYLRLEEEEQRLLGALRRRRRDKAIREALEEAGIDELRLPRAARAAARAEVDPGEPAITPDDVQRVRRKLASYATNLERQLAAGADDLAAAAEIALARAREADAAVADAFLAREQARFDLAWLDRPVPSVAELIVIRLKRLTGAGIRAERRRR